MTLSVLQLLSESSLVPSYMLTYLATKEIHKYFIDMNVGNSDWVMGQTIWVKFLVSTEDFSLLQNIQTGYGANPASYSMVPGVLCRWKIGCKLNKSDHSPPSEATIKNNWCKVVPPHTCHCHEHQKSLPLSLLAVFM